MQVKTQRLNQIMDILQNESDVTTKLLSSRLGVSDMTIRRDIKELSSRGLVHAYYGGISLSQEPSAPKVMNPQQRGHYFEEITHINEKIEIAKYASSLVEPWNAIAIDNGTTCSQMPAYLDPDMPNIIYTYSYMILDQIIHLNNENWRLFVLGGYYHRSIKMFEYSDIISTIKKLHIDKLFLGAAGISLKYGVSCVQPFEIDIRRALIDVSDTVILLSDSSKLDKSWLDHYASIEEIDLLVTDSGISEEQKNEFEQAGVLLHIV